MTKEEISLLLYLETCAVDFGGKVNGRRINKEDIEIAEKWNKEGFVKFGRIKFNNIVGYDTHWCVLSDKAWKVAAKERRNRCERIMAKRPLETE